MSNQVDYPLEFPLPGMEPEIILGLPDSRLPGALRSYRGANARHRGYDFYTGKCGLLVVSAEDGIIIDLNNNEKFPSSTIRDSILEIALEAGFTPDPILENLHGCSITIYHGRDESGKWYYSRLSHLENFSHDWQLGDTVKRGEVIGYVGASGTSAQFKSDEGKEQGCHLHFEWHQINNGEDKILGFDERDNELKRKLLYDLFS